MLKMSDWLIKCKCENVIPVAIEIGGKHSFDGCYYTQNDSQKIYVAGLWPKFRRVRVALTVTEDSVIGKGHEWYRVGWWNQAEDAIRLSAEKVAEYHPFGSNFMIGPWTHSDAIDKYERFQYLRIPLRISHRSES